MDQPRQEIGTLNASLRQIGLTGLVALALLRIGIGLHFYTEGVQKIQDPSPYSEYFFRGAKGHFAPFFRGLVWDPDGLARLDSQATLDAWARYKEQAVKQYGLDANQAKRAQRIHDQRRDQLEWWLALNESDIQEYKRGLERRDRYHADSARMEVASLRGQVASLEAELSSKTRELVGPIDRLWESYVEDLHRLAGSPAGGPIEIRRPGRRILDSESIDSVVRYFDVAVGAMLILGLFTRGAATLAALFLCSVMVSQFPGSPGAIPVWPQFVETLGLVVLAATGAGRFAGLDFLLGSIRGWCCPSNPERTES